MGKKKPQSVQYALRWRLVGNRWRLVGNRWRLVGNRWRLVGNRWQLEVYSYPIEATQHCLHINFDKAQSCIKRIGVGQPWPAVAPGCHRGQLVHPRGQQVACKRRHRRARCPNIG